MEKIIACAVDGIQGIKVGKQINLTARGYARILKVSRTIADMEGSNSILMNHILESLQYRSLERIKSFLV